jgi:hypothetical protein
MMNKAKQILEIASDGGWEHNYTKRDLCFRSDDREFKALLATDKSFLDALVTRYMYRYCEMNNLDYCKYLIMEIYDSCKGCPVYVTTKTKLQVRLINDLTNNNGGNFWEIIEKFIGLEQDND